MNKDLQHIAIIPDGNRTWATNRGLAPNEGHQEGKKRAEETFEYIFENVDSCKAISFWAMSTENVKKRSAIEKSFLFGLLENLLKDLEETLEKHNAGFTRLGSREGLPEGLVKKLDNLQRTCNNVGKKTLNLLFNYGGKRHIQHAFNQCKEQGTNDVEKYMKLGTLPPVDLIIRTKGAIRTSGFLPWEDYAERYFTDLNYPDFTVDQLKIAIQDRYTRKRNFGA